MSWRVPPASTVCAAVAMLTDGGTFGMTLRTLALRVALALALEPLAAFVPVPRAVTWSVMVKSRVLATSGRVQVGVAEVALSRVPPLTDQA